MSGEWSEDVSETRTSFWRRHRALKWTMIVLVAAGAVTAAAISVALHRAEPMLRAYIVLELQQHFHAPVELDSFHVSLASGLRAEGKGLRIWPPAEIHGVTVPATDLGKPLISLDEFRFRAPLHYAPGRPIHVSVVQIKGLTIDMPSKPKFTHAREAPGGPSPSKIEKALIHFDVESILCADVRLFLESSDPQKPPLEFAIKSLKLTHIESGGLMKFDANLTNARPVGAILTKGTFGPWTVDDPGESPISGAYDFEHANLGDFKGIAGTLNSTGKYQGTLRDLTVDGVTDTPDFRLTHFGTPMALHTQFHAEVDGTNGDTWLEPVDATLGQSHFTARGKVVRVAENQAGKKGEDGKNETAQPHMKGHDISLLVDIPRAPMEDFLRLTSKTGSPLLTGSLTMKTSLEIPPGEAPVHERIQLKGRFSLADAQFTNPKIQGRIADLSLRGQGRPKDAKNPSDDAQVRATMQSDFAMARGVITLPDLKYTMPGADIEMKGTYGVEGGALDFAGSAKMQATVSQMLGGWKGLLLKPADRLFKKDGAGTDVPIHITGTRQDPHFGVDFGRLKKTSAERPDEKQ